MKSTTVRTPFVKTVYRTPFVKTTITQERTSSKRTLISDHIRSAAKNTWEGVSDFTQEFLDYDSGCDKYDYAMAAFSGVVSGLIDSFFVQSPLYSPLGNITDRAVDKIVVRFAQWIFRLDEKQKKTYRKMPNTITGAIGFLETRFRTNYDARYGRDLIGGEVLKHFYPGNHHLKSLAHCPDLVGLFFSILDQLTDKTSIVNNGCIVRLTSKAPALGEMNFVSKIVCGFVNWIGHMMSDVAGSSGTRGHAGKRGSGIPIPGFELFQFSKVNVKSETSALSQFTDLMFQKGYDFRFGITMSVPVIINEFLTTLMWGLRQRYIYKCEWKQIFSSLKGDRRLTRMKLVSCGCFTLIDIGDAAIRSQGQLLVFALHLNYVGLCRFAFAGYREFVLRFGHASTNTMNKYLCHNQRSFCF